MSVPPRLRWRCRRGTKELDLVLTRFLETGYPYLDAAQRSDFEALLMEQDPDLVAWLWGHNAPPERWQSLVERIRATAL